MTEREVGGTPLSPHQKCALAHLDRGWVPGPELPDHVLDELDGLRAAGLVERRFTDQGDVSVARDTKGTAFRLRACWHFKATPAGIAASKAGKHRSMIRPLYND